MKTAMNTEPLPEVARQSLVAEVEKTASGKARSGLALIDFREPTAKERAFAETLVPRARELLARRRKTEGS